MRSWPPPPLGSNLRPASLAAYRSAGILLNEEAIIAHLIATARQELGTLAVKSVAGPALLELRDNARKILQQMRIPWQS